MTLYLDGWRPTAIAGYRATSRQTVHEVLRRWGAEGWPGLAELEETEWHPAQRLAPYRPRRPCRRDWPQARLVEVEAGDAAAG